MWKLQEEEKKIPSLSQNGKDFSLISQGCQATTNLPCCKIIKITFVATVFSFIRQFRDWFNVMFALHYPFRSVWFNCIFSLPQILIVKQSQGEFQTSNHPHIFLRNRKKACIILDGVQLCVIRWKISPVMSLPLGLSVFPLSLQRRINQLPLQNSGR